MDKGFQFLFGNAVEDVVDGGDGHLFGIVFHGEAGRGEFDVVDTAVGGVHRAEDEAFFLKVVDELGDGVFVFLDDVSDVLLGHLALVPEGVHNEELFGGEVDSVGFEYGGDVFL